MCNQKAWRVIRIETRQLYSNLTACHTARELYFSELIRLIIGSKEGLTGALITKCV